MTDYGRPFEIGDSGVVGEVQTVAPTIIGPNGSILRALDEIEQTRGAALDIGFFYIKGTQTVAGFDVTS